jgi:hypothetical protein
MGGVGVGRETIQAAFALETRSRAACRRDPGAMSDSLNARDGIQYRRPSDAQAIIGIGVDRFQEELPMVIVTFPDRETEKRALAFLLGRFSGRVLQSGEHLVPEAALEALAGQNIPFTVKGKASYESQRVEGH